MMIFRYHMTNGQTFDEAAPKEIAKLSLAQVRGFLADVISPRVEKPGDAYLVPAFHILTLDGHACVVITHNLSHIQIMIQDDPDPAQVPPSKYRLEVPSGPGERGGYVPDSTEPGPGHLRLAASDGDRVARRSHGGPFGGHTFS